MAYLLDSKDRSSGLCSQVHNSRNSNPASINLATRNTNCWNESPMEEPVLSADEAPANTQTLGPDQTPEGREPENDLQFQAPRNVEGKFLKGQSGNPAGKPPGIRNRATMIVEQLFDGACGEVSGEARAKAMNGASAGRGPIVTRLIER